GLLGLPSILMIFMGIEMLMSTSTQLWMGRARFEYRYKSFVTVTLVTAVLSSALSVLAVLFLPNKGISKIAANTLVVSVTGLVLYVRSISRGRQCFNRTYWHYALSFNIPLIPYYLSQIIFNHSDRLMINKMCGRGDAALYDVAYSLAFMLTFVLNAANNSFVPWLYRKMKEGKLRESRTVTIVIAALMAFLLSGVIALAPEIILVMAGRQYTQAVWVVPPVAMSLLLLFYSQLFINVEFYFEEKYKLVAASIAAAASNIILNYFGIIRFGFVAAGYTTLISYILFAGCNYLSMKKICRERNMDSHVYDVKALSLLFAGFLAVSCLLMALYPFPIARYCLIVAVLILCIVFRTRLLRLLPASFKELF
ncbi:MAG: oligosaccharide flippase family protein, partial [Lachnospiraceae bacterium]|nr:oligosaccharide flippase family protein [Lachnospiraceae bacterium]